MPYIRITKHDGRVITSDRLNPVRGTDQMVLGREDSVDAHFFHAEDVASVELYGSWEALHEADEDSRPVLRAREKPEKETVPEKDKRRR